MNQVFFKQYIKLPEYSLIDNKPQDHGYQPPQQLPSYVPPGFQPAQPGPMAYGGGFGHPGHPGQPPIVAQPQANDGE